MTRLARGRAARLIAWVLMVGLVCSYGTPLAAATGRGVTDGVDRAPGLEIPRFDFPVFAARADEHRPDRPRHLSAASGSEPPVAAGRAVVGGLPANGGSGAAGVSAAPAPRVAVVENRFGVDEHSESPRPAADPLAGAKVIKNEIGTIEAPARSERPALDDSAVENAIGEVVAMGGDSGAVISAGAPGPGPKGAVQNEIGVVPSSPAGTSRTVVPSAPRAASTPPADGPVPSDPPPASEPQPEPTPAPGPESSEAPEPAAGTPPATQTIRSAPEAPAQITAAPTSVVTMPAPVYVPVAPPVVYVPPPPPITPELLGEAASTLTAATSLAAPSLPKTLTRADGAALIDAGDAQAIAGGIGVRDDLGLDVQAAAPDDPPSLPADRTPAVISAPATASLGAAAADLPTIAAAPVVATAQELAPSEARTVAPQAFGAANARGPPPAAGVVISGTDGDDVFVVDSDGAGIRIRSGDGALQSQWYDWSAGQLTIDGGGGNDTLVGPPVDTTWVISGAGSGDLPGALFLNFENLSGAPDNQDTFVFLEGGAISGLVDGGPRGFDTIVLTVGLNPSLGYGPSGIDSGVLHLDGRTIGFAGLEPVLLQDTGESPPADIIVTYTTAVDVTLLMTGDGRLALDSNTSEDVFFDVPTRSLTLRFVDRPSTVTIREVDLGTARLAVEGADVITVAGDITVLGDSGDDGIRLSALRELTVLDGVTLSAGNADIELAVDARAILDWAAVTPYYQELEAPGRLVIGAATLDARNIVVAVDSLVQALLPWQIDLLRLRSIAGRVLPALMAADTVVAFVPLGGTQPDQITRALGSWLIDGFEPGTWIEVGGSLLNDGFYRVTAVDPLTLTLDPATPCSPRSATAAVEIRSVVVARTTAGDALALSLSGNTIRREDNRSWADDGFVAGQTLTSSRTRPGAPTTASTSIVAIDASDPTGRTLTVDAAGALVVQTAVPGVLAYAPAGSPRDIPVAILDPSVALRTNAIGLHFEGSDDHAARRTRLGARRLRRQPERHRRRADGERRQLHRRLRRGHGADDRRRHLRHRGHRARLRRRRGRGRRRRERRARRYVLRVLRQHDHACRRQGLGARRLRAESAGHRRGVDEQRRQLRRRSRRRRRPDARARHGARPRVDAGPGDGSRFAGRSRTRRPVADPPGACVRPGHHYALGRELARRRVRGRRPDHGLWREHAQRGPLRDRRDLAGRRDADGRARARRRADARDHARRAGDAPARLLRGRGPGRPRADDTRQDLRQARHRDGEPERGDVGSSRTRGAPERDRRPRHQRRRVPRRHQRHRRQLDGTGEHADADRGQAGGRQLRAVAGDGQPGRLRWRPAAGRRERRHRRQGREPGDRDERFRGEEEEAVRRRRPQPRRRGRDRQLPLDVAADDRGRGDRRGQ